MASSKTLEITQEAWLDKLQSLHITRSDMNKLIMDYLVTEGFKEAAERFQDESGTQPATTLDSMSERVMIREAIQEGRIEKAISLVNDIHPELLDNDRYLYFHLQYLIELIRNGQLESALEYAQTHLAERGEENVEILPELERTLALLAFENPEMSPFADLLHPSQRQKVASELNSAILEAESRESMPKLAHLLKLLLWSQEQLDSKKVKFPKMKDLAKGEFQGPK
ncbi:glucose-induced degradation protein 8 homolog isoform X2 [Asterias rubens]|uniref:glucose-induced degradation protein 8 homolog isoform X2 n=1 Tax=Asterias rubens TaxID=7604 RepID=UPI001455B8FE|nr:glucose-induced degradation protein 8 homolog isoform X2 [Asterias rubens]